MKKIKIIEKVNINNVIALCYILDDYTSFNQKMMNLLSEYKNEIIKTEIIYDLSLVSDERPIKGTKKVRKFYEENKLVIDTINKYSSIREFYRWFNSIIIEHDLEDMQKYLKENEKDLDEILTVLNAIKDLGIDNLQFDQDLDFTNIEYSINTRFDYNCEISYFDNLKVVPNYQSDCVKYKTEGSNYKIIVQTLYNDFSRNGKTIFVNSLLFDPEKLPEKLDKENIFDKIVNLKEDVAKESTNIKNSIYLNIGIDDLNLQFSSFSRVVDNLENIEEKQQLKDVLLNINSSIKQLYNISSDYDERIIENDLFITREVLEQEKNLCLKRKLYSSIDID